MKINKYNIGKEGTTDSRQVQSGLLVGGISNQGVEVTEEAQRLKETHLIFGQPFNGSQDVSGDISNAQNISASGGDLTLKKDVDAEGEIGGNIYAEGEISAGGNVSGVKFIGDVEADNVTTTSLDASSASISELLGDTLDFSSGEFDSADIKEALINALTSGTITTDFLNVTKQAHFFELIIDQIKAAGGAIILSPADGFKVDKVGVISSGTSQTFRLFWKASNGQRARKNMWLPGDQAICQTFNAAVGSSYNVVNKYYWAVVLDAGSVSLGGEEYNYIQLSTDMCDGRLNPEEGDEIAMLGSRLNLPERQSAIYISAYNSIDPTLKAPLICQYKGITNFNLAAHKHTFLASNGNEIRGNLRIESGQRIEDYVDYNAITITSTLIEYVASDQGTEPPTEEWTTEIPDVPPANYLWTRTTINFSDGTETISYNVVRNGANGKKGDKGDSGADGNSYSANMLLKSQNFDSDLWKGTSYWVDTNETYMGCKVLKREANNYPVYQDCEVEAGETYTFSCYIKSDGGDARYKFQVSNEAVVTPQEKDIPESTEWSRQSVTFKCTQSGMVRCRVYKGTGTGAIYIAGFKLEKGENPNTVWTPAPEELVGTDAEYYMLQPLMEYAIVDSNEDLDLILKYKILHIVGTTSNTITASEDGYFVRFKGNNDAEYTNLSFTDIPTFSEGGYVQGYSTVGEPIYFEVELVKGADVLDRRIVSVNLVPMATFEIAESIHSVVQYTNNRVDEVESNVSSITQTANNIASVVKQQSAQISSVNGTVTGHNTRISSLEQTANGIKSVVESHTTDINGTKDRVSTLEQTAEQIQLQVENVSLQVNSKKIVLDGETEVNGTVNVNKDGTGFRINGSGGESFTIGSNDIGTYSNFENKTVQNWWHLFNDTTINYSTSGDGRLDVNSLSTTLKVGQRLRITNFIINKSDYSFAMSELPDVTISLYRGSVTGMNMVASLTLVPQFSNNAWSYQGTTSMNGSKSAILDYTATSQGEYYLRVYADMYGNQPGYTIISMMLATEISLNAFGNLTYNGFGFNFGAGKIAFISDESVMFKMGADSGLKLTSSDGLQRLVPESYKYSSAMINHRYTNSGKWIGMNDYIVRVVQDLSSGSNKGSIDVVSPKDEMLVVRSTSNNIILLLPIASAYPGKSYIIKNYSSSDNVFVGVGSVTTTNTNGNIIPANGNVGYNDSCAITTSAGTITYRQLMKCSKNAHKLISDGNKWIDCLLI